MQNINPRQGPMKVGQPTERERENSREQKYGPTEGFENFVDGESNQQRKC